MKYPVAKPDVSGNELKYVTEAIQAGEISSKGAFVERFENEFAKYIGTKHAVACSSGTTALTLALAALNLPEGSEVIIPQFTMVATAWAATYNRLTPVFVDCADDLNIDISLIEHAITPRTRAILPVHIYGRPAFMEGVMDIARQYNLHVIEDAAEAHGATFQGKKVGSIGDMGCFSFFGNKIISTGEGGMVTTNDDRLDFQLRHLRSMAFDPDHSFQHPKLGYNFRMPNLSAALGVAQLERIDEFLAKREQIRSWYDSALAGCEKLAIHKKLSDGDVLWMYGILVIPEGTEEKANSVIARRELLMKYLESKGIETRRFFKPMSQQKLYFNQAVGNTRAYKYACMGLYLPTHTSLTKEDVEFIASQVKEFLCSTKQN